ncbi:3480_t:CDS:2 [Ambispora gerdemannii]|uniref:3480_t:CDS:1 n=1 Tax=Ambispora gerdemannii TaxID=144530 RepID=A0A9N8VDJ3_9GLOM|nr:3480_t:CDS:2 [Ambispora gerdemannii]
MNTRLAPKKVSIALAVLSPACFLATAALQQLQVVENSVLPFLYNFFLRKDIPFVMTGVMFFWVYVLTASLSVVAQAAGLRNGYDNNEPRHYKPSVRGAFGRMIAAHQVALESVPAFFAVVIIASAKQVPLEYRIDFSILYTFLRIIHTPLYILNFDIARAITHMMATSCVAWLFAFALIPGFERNYYSFIMDVVRLQRGVSSGGFWGID